MDMVAIGLLLISFAWLLQLFFLFKDGKNIQPLFIIVYMVGVLLLVISAFSKGGITGAKFEIITLAASGVVLLKLFFD